MCRVDRSYNKIPFERAKAAVRAVADNVHKSSRFLKGCFITDVLLQPPAESHPPDATASSRRNSLSRHQSHVMHSVQGGRFSDKLHCVLEQPFFRDMNFNQREAIKAAASSRVTLIHGPPGTGKTVTTVGLIRCIRDVGYRGGPVLACAQCNTAVDNLTEECHKAGLDVVRIGAPSKVRPYLFDTVLENRVQQAPGVQEAEAVMKVG